MPTQIVLRVVVVAVNRQLVSDPEAYSDRRALCSGSSWQLGCDNTERQRMRTQRRACLRSTLRDYYSWPRKRDTLGLYGDHPPYLLIDFHGFRSTRHGAYSNQRAGVSGRWPPGSQYLPSAGRARAQYIPAETGCVGLPAPGSVIRRT
jgi:hypothetical protein